MNRKSFVGIIENKISVINTIIAQGSFSNRELIQYAYEMRRWEYLLDA
jgi:hypothetical protein